jgi:hypothetical protein
MGATATIETCRPNWTLPEGFAQSVNSGGPTAASISSEEGMTVVVGENQVVIASPELCGGARGQRLSNLLASFSIAVPVKNSGFRAP